MATFSVNNTLKLFDTLGLNIPKRYEFNVSDLNVSAKHLYSFLAGGQPPAWEALSYLTADCNYGGRVTDLNDRRLMRSLLSRFYNDQVKISARSKYKYLRNIYFFKKN